MPRRLLVLCSLVLTVSVSLSKALAEALSRSDKLRAMYSNRFTFDRRGIPLITIGIIEGTDQVVLSSDIPLRILPDGEDGPEVIGGKRWRVDLEAAQAAVVEYFVVLEQAPAAQAEALREKMKIWRSRGVRALAIEIGAVYGMKGQVFDNRALLLAEGPFSSQEKATARGEQYRQRNWLTEVRTTAQLKQRPTGGLMATDLDSGTRIQLQDAIWFTPQKSRHLLSVKSALNRSGHYTGQLGGQYRGQLYVTIDRRGKLAVVNVLPADELLAGLVSAEIFPSAPPAALRAQAVAARGNLLAKIGLQSLADPYLTCAWQRCQVYRGAGHEDRRTTQAIAATRGLVLMRTDGQGLVDAVYHADSGGFTEDNENVWPGEPNPSLRGKLDAPPGTRLAAFAGGINDDNVARWLALRPAVWSARSGVNEDKLRWTVRRSVQQLSLSLASRKVGRVREIAVLERGRSGRAKAIAVRGSHGRVVIHGELNIRRALGNLRSSMFVVRPIESGRAVTSFEFVGGGWGHGVGMCQTGAIGMAKANKDFRRILSHYYSNSVVKQIY